MTPAPSGPGDPDRAEQVLSQALRVMAGGGRRSEAERPGALESGPWWDRATTSFLFTLAVLIGLVVGGVIGFASLLL